MLRTVKRIISIINYIYDFHPWIEIDGTSENRLNNYKHTNVSNNKPLFIGTLECSFAITNSLCKSNPVHFIKTFKILYRYISYL